MNARKPFRMTRLHLAAHLAALVPLAWLAVDALTGSLTANPIQAATQRAGLYALSLLTASLACTPIHIVTHYGPILKLRKPLGLYAFMYAALHVFIVVGVDYAFVWEFLLEDLGEKRYIFAGLGAFIILSALAATSFKKIKRRMGKRWKQLHKLVYLAAGLVVLHFTWVVKGSVERLAGDILQPVLFGTGLAVLLAMRVPRIKNAIRQRLPVPRWAPPGQRAAQLKNRGGPAGSLPPDL